jgi:hypothetical protein
LQNESQPGASARLSLYAPRLRPINENGKSLVELVEGPTMRSQFLPLSLLGALPLRRLSLALALLLRRP